MAPQKRGKDKEGARGWESGLTLIVSAEGEKGVDISPRGTQGW